MSHVLLSFFFLFSLGRIGVRNPIHMFLELDRTRMTNGRIRRSEQVLARFAFGCNNIGQSAGCNGICIRSGLSTLMYATTKRGSLESLVPGTSKVVDLFLVPLCCSSWLWLTDNAGPKA